jgi:hypothetical protein
MRPVSLALQTPCSGRETVFPYWMQFARSFGYGVFIRILMGHYHLAIGQDAAAVGARGLAAGVAPSPARSVGGSRRRSNSTDHRWPSLASSRRRQDRRLTARRRRAVVHRRVLMYNVYGDAGRGRPQQEQKKYHLFITLIFPPSENTS